MASGKSSLGATEDAVVEALASISATVGLEIRDIERFDQQRIRSALRAKGATAGLPTALQSRLRAELRRSPRPSVLSIAIAMEAQPRAILAEARSLGHEIEVDPRVPPDYRRT